MAFERLGIGAVLTVDEKQYTAGMGRAETATTKFNQKVSVAPTKGQRFGRAITAMAAKVKASAMAMAGGFKRMGAGIQSLAFAALPMGVGLGFATNSAASFQHQMSAVGAVSRANAQEMAMLGTEAERMGILSAFSATQSAEGMELMARAGAKPKQIIAGLSGVMNAAAADQIEMATAADVVAQSVKINELGWERASHVADTFALASASANTDIVALGEAMKMGGMKAHSMGMSFDEITGVLAKFADAGLKGTMGGTALQNMLVKLTRPTSKSAKMFEEFGIKLTDGAGKMRKVPAILGDVNLMLSKIPDDAERAAAAAEVFGIRGERGYNAFATAGKDSLEEYIKTLEASSDVTDKNGKKIGAAQQMAERRLDNVKGQLTLLKSSFEGLAIKMFGPLMEPFQGVIETLKTGLNTVLEAYTDLSKAMTSQDIEAAEKKYGKTAVAIATGLGQAVTWLKEAFTSVIDKVREFSQMFKESVGEDGLTVLAAAFWPVVLVLGAIGLAYSFLRKENETLLETATRVFGGIKAWVVDVYQNAVLPFIEGIRSFWVPVIEDLGRSWNFVITSIKTLFSELFESFSSVAGGISVNWKMVGQIFMAVFSSILKIAMFVIEGLVRGFKILMFPIRIVLQAVKNIATGFAALFSGNILEGFKRMGLGLLDFVLSRANRSRGESGSKKTDSAGGGWNNRREKSD